MTNPAQETPLPSLQHNREGEEPYNRLPDSTRLEIAERVLEIQNISAVAREYGVSRKLVTSIAREFFGEKRELEDIFISQRLYDVAQKAISELKNRDLSKTSTSQLGVLIGIAIDKAQQLTGKPSHSDGSINLRVAWKDGGGAVEITTRDNNKR